MSLGIDRLSLAYGGQFRGRMLAGGPMTVEHSFIFRTFPLRLHVPLMEMERGTFSALKLGAPSALSALVVKDAPKLDMIRACSLVLHGGGDAHMTFFPCYFLEAAPLVASVGTGRCMLKDVVFVAMELSGAGDWQAALAELNAHQPTAGLFVDSPFAPVSTAQFSTVVTELAGSYQFGTTAPKAEEKEPDMDEVLARYNKEFRSR